MKLFSLYLLVAVVLVVSRVTAVVIPFRMQGSPTFDDQFPLEIIYSDKQEDVLEPCVVQTPAESAVPVATNTVAVSTTEIEVDRVVIEERPLGEDGAIEIVEEVIVEEVIETVMEVVYETVVEEEPTADSAIVEENQQSPVQPETVELEVWCGEDPMVDCVVEVITPLPEVEQDGGC